MLRLQIGHESFRFTSNSPHEEQVHKWWHGARIQALCLSIQMTHSAFNIQHSGLLAEKKKNRVIIFLSTSIYDLVLLHVCHFHHHCLIVVQLSLSRYSCLHLGSLHPRIFFLIFFLLFLRFLRSSTCSIILNWCKIPIVCQIGYDTICSPATNDSIFLKLLCSESSSGTSLVFI